MTLPSGLVEPVKKRALKRRQEFKEKYFNLDEKSKFDRKLLRESLESARQLLDDYDAIYSDDLKDSSVEHLAHRLNFYRSEFENTWKEFDKNHNTHDIFKLQRYHKTTCEYITEYEHLLRDMGFREFDN